MVPGKPPLNHLDQVLPLCMAATYAFLLPKPPKVDEVSYEPVPDDVDDGQDESSSVDSVDLDLERPELARTMSERMQALTQRAVASPPKASNSVQLSTADKLALARPLFVKYMLPLFFVYLAEYTINTGVAPTLLYPPPIPAQSLLLSSIIKSLRDYYPFVSSLSLSHCHWIS